MPSIRNLLDGFDDRQVGALALVVGTVLLVNPLYLTALHVDSSSYTYRTVAVHAEDGDLVFEDVPEGDPAYGPIAGIGCTGSTAGGDPLACQIDHHVAANGPLTVSDGYHGGAEYTLVDGTFYRRVEREVNGSVRLDLERTSPEAVLEDVAIPHASLTWPGRVAVRVGSVATTYPLTHANHVVRTPDGYRYVYRRTFRDLHGGGGLAGHALRLGGVAAGALLLVGGYRRLPGG